MRHHSPSKETIFESFKSSIEDLAELGDDTPELEAIAYEMLLTHIGEYFSHKELDEYYRSINLPTSFLFDSVVTGMSKFILSNRLEPVRATMLANLRECFLHFTPLMDQHDLETLYTSKVYQNITTQFSKDTKNNYP